MALTLTGTIDDDTRVLHITGTVSEEIGPGYRFRLDDELLELTRFGPRHFAPGDSRSLGFLDRNVWYCRRGLLNSTPARHEADVTLRGADDAWSAAADEETPGPFPPLVGDVAATDVSVDGSTLPGTPTTVQGALEGLAARTVIAVDETGITTHVLAGPYDSRGRGSLGLFTEVRSDAASSVQVQPLTRIVGRPWMWLPAFEPTNTQIITSRGTIWPSFGTSTGGGKIPTAWLDGFAGLLEETVIVVAPSGNTGGAPAGATVGTGDGAVAFLAGDTLVDAGNRVSVEYVDPGAANSPLSISSPDGWAIKVNLETDGDGVIVTTAGEIALLFGAFGDPSGWLVTASEPVDGALVVSATGPVPFTGGDGLAGAVDVTIRGWL